MARGEGKGEFSGYCCVKWIFFVFNIIFWLLGCALLGVGIWVLVDGKDYGAMTPSSDYFSVSAVSIAAGCVMIVVSFFGCCGAIMENKCMLIFYFVLVLIIFVLEISFGIIAFVFRNEIDDKLSKELRKGMQEEYGKDKSLTTAWDEVQENLKCCGLHNKTDWFRVSAWPDEDRVPESCCWHKADGCGDSLRIHEDLIFSHTCYKKVKDEASRYLLVLGVIGLVVGVLQILGLVAAMALFCFLRSDDKYGDYYTT